MWKFARNTFTCRLHLCVGGKDPNVWNVRHADPNMQKYPHVWISVIYMGTGDLTFRNT